MSREDYEEEITKLLQDEALEKSSSKGMEIKSDTVKNVDFMATKNAEQHRTSRFRLVSQMNTPVFRRGEPFAFKIIFSKPFDINNRDLGLRFFTGPDPNLKDGSLVKLDLLPVQELPKEPKWLARVADNSDTKQLELMLEVKASPSCPIGIWKMDILTQNGATAIPFHFYIIFNAWCEDDGVYMENSDWRKEYLLSEDGVMYTGIYNKNKPNKGVGKKFWNYAQYSSTVALPTMIYTLEKLRLQRKSFSDPIIVSRAVSSIVSTFIIKSNWSGKYKDGTDPRDWKGSKKILKQFMSDLKRVKYAQCWVFAGVGCTLCRAVGIPSRPISTFESGRDSDQNLVIDWFYDKYGKLMPKKNHDFKWNFHAWTECWMARPDLPKDCGGWQAVELCTPGDPEYRIGPASLVAIKNGDVSQIYDTFMMYSKVNSDEKFWKEMGKGEFKLHKTIKDSVGVLILTKSIGKITEEDVTLSYKYKEGSAEERERFEVAYSHVKEKHRTPWRDERPWEIKPKSDVTFEILPSQKQVIIGDKVEFAASAHNHTEKDRTIAFTMRADSVEYNRVLIKTLLIDQSGTETFSDTVKIPPKEKREFGCEIDPDTYLQVEEQHLIIRLSVFCCIRETSDDWLDETFVNIEKPEMNVKMPESLKIGTAFVIHVEFTNPLNKQLKSCFFTIDGNVFKEQITQQFRNVEAKENVVHDIQLMPEVAGKCRITTYFDSDLLKEIQGFGDVDCSAA